ncbi:MAG: hypothetical protein HY762_03465 [Planctomycetes bacterium]|nr:hypothetical protein [Planctomycetota bacterium]
MIDKLTKAVEKAGGKFKLAAQINKKLRLLRLAGAKQEHSPGANHLMDRLIDEILEGPND